MSISRGTLIGGKYLLSRLLGEGGCAAVWEAENTLVGRRVAFKMLHQDLSTNRDVRDRFLAEARAAARIAHPNVVDVFDLGVSDDNCPYMVMELCDGETLEHVIESRGRMGLGYATDLMLQVLAALDAAHLHGIVHRDLKPANVMVVHPQPDRPLVKVLDFGIAIGVFSESLSPKETGELIGTPAYMPPEQALGEVVDARADIYASAAIFYELLCGQPVFDGPTQEAILSQVLTQEPVPITRRVPAIPAAINDLLVSALSKSAEARPSTVTDFMHAIVPFSVNRSMASLLPDRSSEQPLPLVARNEAVSPPAPKSQKLELVIEPSIPPPAMEETLGYGDGARKKRDE